MKKQTLILGIIAIAMPLLAQESPDTGPKEVKPDEPADVQKDVKEKGESDRDSKFREHQLKLMNKALEEIGVSEEQRQQIFVLQEAHMKKMKANWIRINKARRELSRLQDGCAPIEDLDAAIAEVSDATAEQLHILVRNRLELERILGKEKSDQFMEKARQFYRSHGRRPGAGMPPRPEAPPNAPSADNAEKDARLPPGPPVPPGETIAPPPA